MGDQSPIEWTDATWNPMSGCTKVSQGCKHCYAERIFARPYPGRKFTDVRTHPNRLKQPVTWQKPRRIFVNSMSDLFHEDVPFEFIDRVFLVMACTTRHTYQVLTKRPKRMLKYFDRLTDGDRYTEWFPDLVSGAEWPGEWMPQRSNHGGYDNCGPLWPLTNVWLGVSVENQETAEERIPLLLETPAAVRFVSAEPLLGPVDLAFRSPYMIRDVPLDWVIAGGESGPKARPSHPDWFRSLRDQCVAAGVAFLFKQWGEWFPGEIDNAADGRGWVAYPDIDHDQAADDWGDYRAAYQRVHDAGMLRVGKKRAGRMLDGRTWDQYPSTGDATE